MNKKYLILASAIAVAIILAATAVRLFKCQRPFLGAHQMNAKTSSGESYSSIYGKAQKFESKGELSEAKSAYQELVNSFTSSPDITNWQKKIEELNIRLLFSSTLTPKSVVYEIKPGDSLSKLAREFGTTTELIMRSNNLPNDKIFPGRKIKVWTGSFNIIVDKSQNILLLKSDEEVIKTYIVSTGKNNCTPAGNFKIVNKLLNPTWFKAGAVVPAESPENVLGTRWMGFDLAGYGIHGTIEPHLLGSQVTEGCVRMRNNEVEELYTIVPVGTEVTIIE